MSRGGRSRPANCPFWAPRLQGHGSTPAMIRRDQARRRSAPAPQKETSVVDGQIAAGLVFDRVPGSGVRAAGALRYPAGYLWTVSPKPSYRPSRRFVRSGVAKRTWSEERHRIKSRPRNQAPVTCRAFPKGGFGVRMTPHSDHACDRPCLPVIHRVSIRGNGSGSISLSRGRRGSG
jgi:hypothetical protein